MIPFTEKSEAFFLSLLHWIFPPPMDNLFSFPNIFLFLTIFYMMWIIQKSDLLLDRAVDKLTRGAEIINKLRDSAVGSMAAMLEARASLIELERQNDIYRANEKTILGHNAMLQEQNDNMRAMLTKIRDNHVLQQAERDDRARRLDRPAGPIFIQGRPDPADTPPDSEPTPTPSEANPA